MSASEASRVARGLALARNVLTHRLFQAAFVLLLCAAGTHHYLGVVDKIYPAEDWLFFRLAKLWGYMALLSVSCVCAGHFVIEKLLRFEFEPLEAAVQSMAVGLVAFVMCMYVGGALQLYGKVFAIALPLAMIALGARSTVRLVRRARSEWQKSGPVQPFVWLLWALGACAVGLAYLGVMTPDSLNYDSTWSHLVIAQDYARHGRILKFLGNYNMGVPHLASIVHTWSFTVPGLEQPALRWMMALHNEFALFCWTLAGVAAGVRRMLGEPALRGSWVAFFLFPIIFVYDNNMGGAADHVAAFFVVPLFLATASLWDTFQPRAAALVAISAAGALLTKYQAFYLFVPLGLILCVRGIMLAIRLKRGRLRPEDPAVGFRDLIRTPLVLAGVGALLVAPHFLKNAIFYHNPLYPLGQDLFTSSTPSSPNAGPLIRYIFTDDNWRPKGTTFQKLRHALNLYFTFSFEPHYSFTKNWPAFGSLFTLLLPALLVLRRSLYIWLGTLLVSGAILLWGYTYNIDRNLQIFLPLMVCVTAALVRRCWQLGWIARAGLVPLVLLQVVWGGDAFFYSASDRIHSSITMIKSGYDGAAKRRFNGYRSQFLAINKALPKNARVLLHTSHLTLGIEREVVMDWDAFQGFISYDELRTERELYDYLKARGITHFLLEPRVRSAPTKQEEVLFMGLLRHAEPAGNFGHFRLYRFPKKPPPARPPYRVVTVGLGRYADGLYPIQKLNTHEYLPPYVQRFAAPDQPLPGGTEERLAMIEQADAVIVGASIRDPALTAALQQNFSEVVRYEGYFGVHVRGKAR
jgi:hypothetical protein